MDAVEKTYLEKDVATRLHVPVPTLRYLRRIDSNVTFRRIWRSVK